MEPEELTKIYIELSEEGGPSGESFWAKPLGNNLYELRNSPWNAYDLHFLDVVRAVPDNPEEKPRIREVVQRSGHKTLRVLFAEGISEEKKFALMKQVNILKAHYERASDRLFALDVEPDGDYQAVCDSLWAWEQQGILRYETGTTSDIDSSTKH